MEGDHAPRVQVRVCFGLPPRPQRLSGSITTTKGTPRTPDGKPDLSAPTPRRPDGKPDLSGVWMGVTKYMINIAANLKEDVPFQPWAAAEYNRRRDSESKDDPSARCLPLSIPLR